MAPEYAQQLETIRNIIVAGWMILFLGWCVQLGFDSIEDRKKGTAKGTMAKAAPKTYCPLHRVAREECEAKHHDAS